MQLAIELLLLALAAYRLARLLAVDDGPFDLFHRLRAALGAYDLGPNGEPVSGWGRLVSCPHCIGVWAALTLWLLMWLPWGSVVVMVLAAAGAQSWLWSMTER